MSVTLQNCPDCLIKKRHYYYLKKMIASLKNNKNVMLRPLLPGDVTKLFKYFNDLSADTRSRFGPHAFDWITPERLCRWSPADEWRFIAEEMTGHKIVAYAIIKKGYLLHDANRLSNYGLLLSDHTDCTFAPSVADAWQSSGLGMLMNTISEDDLFKRGIKNIILWGGVQATNEKAVNFYKKLGYQFIASFLHDGKDNFDMVKNLD